MKTCSNPDCSYHTEFADYLQCPRCGSPMLEAQILTGSLPAEGFSEATTSPYEPVNINRLRPEYEGPPQYVQQPLPYEESYSEYTAAPAMYASEPLRTVPPDRLGRVRAGVMAVGGLVLIFVCLVLGLSLGNRFTQRPIVFNGAAGLVATQTVIASLRPPVNTPIPILPTIPLSVADSAQPIAITNQQDQIQNPKSGYPLGDQNPLALAPIIDALMCTKLDGGQPVGATGAYHATDPFNLAVKAAFGPGGAQAVTTRWYGPGNAQIYEMTHTYSQQGTYYAGFKLSKSGPWSAGDYRVEIYMNGSLQPAQSVSFAVIP